MVLRPEIGVSGHLSCVVLGPDGFVLTTGSWMRVCGPETGADAESVPPPQERAFRSAPP